MSPIRYRLKAPEAAISAGGPISLPAPPPRPAFLETDLHPVVARKAPSPVAATATRPFVTALVATTASERPNARTVL